MGDTNTEHSRAKLRVWTSTTARGSGRGKPVARQKRAKAVISRGTNQSILNLQFISCRYSITATSNAVATVTTRPTSFDTILRVYLDNGGGLTALTLLAYNDDCYGYDHSSCLTFTMSRGTVYAVQLSGFSNSRGTAQVALSVA